MQRAKRRLACSRASVNTPTNSSSRTRRRSRTASAGGDCITISKDCDNQEEISETKSKLRSNKKNTRLNSMKLKKNTKIKKFQRPTYRSLQNAVVLAPFHTLKKCFQTKLVDLYSKEKVKNLNKKVKMAKKQNVSFDYDVVELKSVNAKKDEKPSVSRKKRFEQVRAKKKRNNSSRSLSYCQCDKNTGKNVIALEEDIIHKTNSQQQSLKGNEIQSLEPSPFRPSPLAHSFNSQEIKKRKIEKPISNVMSLKNDFETQQYGAGKSNENIPEGSNSTASDLSSKMDSWETFSDSFSCKEEHLQGSLAISTTSFDSFLEQCDKNHVQNLNRCSSNAKCSKYCMQYKTAEGGKEDGAERFLPTKPQLSDSGHIMINSETKTNDDGIVDFMDREPLARGISKVDITQNLHPLRRQSRTKEKKPEGENALCTSYYLRSITSNKEGLKQLDVSEESLNLCSSKNNSRVSASTNRCNGIERRKSNKGFQETTKIFTINENEREDRNVLFRTDEKLLKVIELENKQPTLAQSSYEPSSSTSKTLESYSQTDEMIQSSTNTLLTKKKSSTQNVNNNVMPNNETEPHCEIFHQRKSSVSPTEQEDTQDKESNEEDKLKKDSENICKNSSKILPPLGEEHNIMEPSGQLLPNINQINYRLHESPDKPFEGLIQHSEPRESCFIFGPSNFSSRLGESCEYSFGLNWVLSSDEEDSNQNDPFFFN